MADWVEVTRENAAAVFDQLQREAMADALAWLDELNVTPAVRQSTLAQAAVLAAAQTTRFLSRLAGIAEQTH